MIKSFDEVIEKVKTNDIKTIAVAVAEDAPVLEALRDASKNGIAKAILVGDKGKIEAVAKSIGMNLENFEIIDERDNVKAALKATEIVSLGKADMLMKGLIDTKSFLKAVLNKEVGLRTGKLMSHVAVFETETFDKLLFVTDAAFNVFPNLHDKKQILENSVDVARAIGVSIPKVAPICAVEVVNPNMPNTEDSQALMDMQREGKIKNCLVQGPLALDNAISSEAASHKGISGEVAGNADILLMPNIEVANVMYKALTYFTKSKNGGILVGTSAPVVLTSRADTHEAKMYSIALAALVANFK